MNNSGENTTKVLIGAGVGCVVLVLCLAVGAFTGVFGLVWLTRAPEDIQVSVSTTLEAEVGDEIRIEIRVDNRSAKATTLSSIDFNTAYLDGIAISSSTPAYVSVDGYESFGDSYQTYYFDETLAPQQSLAVTFIGRAIAVGDHSGDLDVCVGSDFSCVNSILRTVVR